MKLFGLLEKFKALVGVKQASAPDPATTECAAYFDSNGELKVVKGGSPDTEHFVAKSQNAGHAITLTTTATTDVTLPTTGTLETTSGATNKATAAVDGHKDLTTGVHGVSTGDIVGTDKVQTLTNKYLNGGTASSSNKWKLPSDTFANISALTRAEGLVYYATDLDTVFIDDGTTLVPVGSGSGSGEKNYIENPSAASSTTGWVASSANITIARTTTAAQCPRENTTGTALSLTSSTDEAYAHYRFTLDDVDLSKKLKTALAFINADTSDAWRIEVWKNSASDYSGTYTELSLSTDSSGNSYLPVTTGEYKTTFDADTIAWLELRIVHNGTNSDVLYISDVIVGPGSVVTGAVVEEWKSFTPSLSNVTKGTNGTLSGRYRRVGSSAEFDIHFGFGSDSSVSGTVYFNMPSGMTVDASALALAGGDNANLGSITFLDNGAANHTGRVAYLSTTQLNLYADRADSTYVTTGFAINGTSPFTWAANDKLVIKCTVPIAEWAGSGTVNLAGNDVEYVYNSTAASSVTNSTNFAYGAVGGPFPNDTPGAAFITRRVQLKSPLQNGDMIITEVDLDGTGNFIVAASTLFDIGANIAVSPFTKDATAYRGISQPMGVSGQPLQFDVWFGKYPYSDGTSITWATADFSVARWRVRKVSASSVAGFEMHKPGVSAGLVPAQGLDGRTDGVAVLAGKVGEKITWVTPPSTQNTTTSIADWTNANIILTPGVWLVQASVTVGYTTGATAGSSGYTRALITDTSNNIVQEMDKSVASQTAAAASSRITTALPFSFVANVSSNTTYKIRVAHVDSAGTGSGFAGNEGVLRSQFFAVRIA